MFSKAQLLIKRYIKFGNQTSDTCILWRFIPGSFEYGFAQVIIHFYFLKFLPVLMFIMQFHFLFLLLQHGVRMQVTVKQSQCSILLSFESFSLGFCVVVLPTPILTAECLKYLLFTRSFQGIQFGFHWNSNRFFIRIFISSCHTI